MKKNEQRYTILMKKVTDYIRTHFSDSNLSLNEIADYVDLSPNHLSRVFSHEQGCTLIHFVTLCRLERAKELLRTTNLRSNAISEMVGYVDPHYFSAIFKRNTGMTPTEYREKCSE